jgi:hypothetical protein
MIEQRTSRTVNEITDAIGQPLYDNSSRTCYMRAPEEFSKKEQFCDAGVTIYYRVTPADKDRFAGLAKEAIEKHMGFSLHKSGSTARADTVDYEMGAQDISHLNNATCGASVRYPAIATSSLNLSDGVMAVSFSCYMQTMGAIYPMVNR